mgnify:CR=1 FL=1
MPKKWAVLYISGIVASYITGMVLVVYGAVVVGNGENLNNACFWAGLAVWVPTCITSVLTSLSSNYGKQIEEKEKEIEAIAKKKKD